MAGGEGHDPRSLIGDWALSRQVCDQRSGTTGTVAGRLVLRSELDAIIWDEHGRLSWNGRDTSVYRTYRFTLGPDGWWLRFSDERPFHRWQPGAWVEHACGEDIYRGLITVAGTDEWQVRWEVAGPSKSQLITTQLVRN
jgi:hypothetical protein